MMNLNKVTLVGILGSNVEYKVLSNGKTVANYSLITTHTYKDDSETQKKSTTWHNIVTWGFLAESSRDRLNKGDQLAVEGKISTRSWKTKSHGVKYTTEIIANELTFLNYDACANESNSYNMATQSQINEAIASVGINL